MKLKYAIVIILLNLSMLHSAQAQEMVRKELPDGQPVFHLKETNTIFTSVNDTVVVFLALPQEMLAKRYAGFDLKENDQVVMVNAKPIKSVEALEKTYEALSVDAELKLGVRRAGKFLIKSIKKADPENIKRRPGVMIRMDGDGSSEMRPIMGTGLMVESLNGRVEVVDKVHDLDGVDIKEGDQILQVNGKKVESPESMAKLVEEIKAGEKVEITYLRDKKEQKCAFKKADVRIRKIIRN